MSQLTDKVAVITGAASGIGAATAALFIERGAKVVLADIDEQRGALLADNLGHHAYFHHTDVTNEDEIAGAVRAASDQYGRLDVMVNNAGRVGRWTRLTDTSADEWDSAFAVLSRSIFLGTKYAAQAMVVGGAIINVSSVAAVRTGFGPHPYGAAKSAILQLTRSAAQELAPQSIRVNTVTPGGVATRIVGHGKGLEGEALDASIESVRRGLTHFQPLPRAGEGRDIAAAVGYLASDDASFVTGHNLVVDGGLTLGKDWPTAYRTSD